MPCRAPTLEDLIGIEHVVMACGDHPRIRGEHRKRSLLKRFVTGSSPHTRGALTRSWPSSSASGIIPAYAGSTTSWAIANAASGDHPRIRGEHSFACLHDGRVASGDRDGIIPAYAGSTWARAARPATPRDHPRIRGEHVRGVGVLRFVTGSSPHTRGALRTVTSMPAVTWIIPAYAGSTTSSSAAMIFVGDHPRIRGEHASWVTCAVSITGSSPHTRGAPHIASGGGFFCGIIPAYAGSTCCGRRCCGCRWDHPRIRGEHLHFWHHDLEVPGSSPHTRGAPII